MVRHVIGLFECARQTFLPVTFIAPPLLLPVMPFYGLFSPNKDFQKDLIGCSMSVNWVIINLVEGMKAAWHFHQHFSIFNSSFRPSFSFFVSAVCVDPDYPNGTQF